MRGMRLHSLMPGLVAAALSAAAAPSGPVVISEFMAANTRTLRDESGRTPDWIELHNRSAGAVDLTGWRLVNGVGSPVAGSGRAGSEWVIPSLTLQPGERRVVFASGKVQRDPAKALHADFKLSGEGERLALLRPDGAVASEFGEGYPVQFEDVSFGYAREDSPIPWYLPAPSPGRANLAGDAKPGPVLDGQGHGPAMPNPGDPVRVWIRCRGNPSPVKEVKAFWRVQFEAEQVLALNDAGQDGDVKAGDGVWSGTLASAGAKAGGMLRWRFEAVADDGGGSRWPLFPDPARSARYLGAVVGAGVVTSALPVMHLFIDPAKRRSADTEEGARAAVGFLGGFYDNVLVKVRGNSTQAFPKKSHRLEFNAEHPFLYATNAARIRKTSLMAEWGDPTYLRQHLSFWLAARAGVPAPFHEPVRVQLNGAFYQLAMHSQVLGEELLERTGLDPEGALYKAVGTLTPGGYSTGGLEKKTRRWEQTGELDELAVALASRRNREREVFERCDVPAVINYLAVARLTQEDDDIWANLSMYREPDGFRRWRPVAFDMNVSWGFSFAHGGILSTQDDFRSHPFWGSSDIGNNQGYNGLYEAVIRTASTREMLLRRMRTLLDRDWKGPAEGGGLIEGHVAEMQRRMAPEAVLDRQRWGIAWTQGGPVTPDQALAAGVRDLLGKFVVPRRRHFLVTHAAGNPQLPVGVGQDRAAGIPGPQPADAVVQIAAVGRGTDRRQDWVRLTNPNPYAVDVSGWKLAGDVEFELPPGMVIPSKADAWVVASPRGFRERMETPKPGEGLFVVGGYKGKLGEGRPIELRDGAGRVVHRR